MAGDDDSEASPGSTGLDLTVGVPLAVRRPYAGPGRPREPSRRRHGDRDRVTVALTVTDARQPKAAAAAACNWQS